MVRAALCALLAVIMLTGCIHAADRTYTVHRETTLGQELEDLEAAYENGVVSEREYRRLRARLLEQY